MQPAGDLLKSAHAVVREFEVLKALYGGPLHLCLDKSVLGWFFYLISYSDGCRLWDPALPGLKNEQRDVVYRELCRVLAAILQGVAKQAQDGNASSDEAQA